MDGQKMLEIGIDVLKSIDTENIETVDIDRTAYDDGSVTFSVSVTLPAKETGVLLDGEEIKDLYKKD